jgi:hypothetical protein
MSAVYITEETPLNVSEYSVYTTVPNEPVSHESLFVLKQGLRAGVLEGVLEDGSLEDRTASPPAS